MSKSLLIELQCFPTIYFFVEALKHDHLILEGQENYRKGTYRNRYHIAGPNGLQRLSIPLAGGKHQQQPIQEVGIAYGDNWENQHWRSLTAAYGRAPFFIHYEEEIKDILFSKATTLWSFSMEALKCCVELLDLELDWTISPEFIKTPAAPISDYRNHFRPKTDENPIGKDQLIRYPQVFPEKNGFMPNLSILDLIFCQGPQAGILLQKAALK